MSHTANKAETFSDIINGDTPVLVDFTAEWCGPCKMMKPVLQQLHEEIGDDVRIIKVDIDQSPAASAHYNVNSVPTLILFQKGKIMWRQSGVLSAASLKKIITQFSTK
jgi:thioredoxin 1